MATKVTDLKSGDRIELNYGPMAGSDDATVIGVDSSTAGWFAEVQTDDGRIERIQGEASSGIGWKVAA